MSDPTPPLPRVTLGDCVILRNAEGAVVYDSRVPLAPEEDAALSALFADILTGTRGLVYDPATQSYRLVPPLPGAQPDEEADD